MPEAGEQPAQTCARVQQDRRWWIKMLVASGALAAVLLGACFLTPVAQLRYHAWRFKSCRDTDGRHLLKAAELLVARRAGKQVVINLLGEPVPDPAMVVREKDEISLCYRYYASPILVKGYRIILDGDAASAVKPYQLSFRD